MLWAITIYEKGRFLFKSDDLRSRKYASPYSFTRILLSLFWKPTYLLRSGRQTLKDRDTGDKVAYFSISDTDTIDVFEQALNCYLAHNVSDGHTAKFHTVHRIGTPETEKAKRHAEAIEMKKDGKTRQEIVEATGLSARTVAKVTKGENKNAERDAEIIRRYNNKQKQDDISAEMIADGYKASLRTVKTVIQKYKRRNT